MLTSDFSYHLPDEQIAQYPLEDRVGSRLLVLRPDGTVEDKMFSQITALLEPGDLLVLNNTRVLAARVYGQKLTGGKIEVLVERVVDDTIALVHMRSSKSPKPGTEIVLGDQVKACVEGREDELFRLSLKEKGSNWYELLERDGHMPLPPYIGRGDESLDESRYQTVFAKEPGAVAAPTAGLHFSEGLLDELRNSGVETTEVTLHVGAGTFQPVRVDHIDDHVLHSERVEVSEMVCEKITACKARGGRVVAVGTTCVRSLEAAAASGELAPFSGETRMFIKPGYRFRVIDALLTNFHLPESTLIMLVAAFAGHQPVMNAYRHAVQAGYRFFSYGDAMFMEKAE